MLGLNSVCHMEMEMDAGSGHEHANVPILELKQILDDDNDVNSSSDWSTAFSSDLLSIWSASSDVQSLHPSTWPEEVALPRFPPDPSPVEPSSLPYDNELGDQDDADDDYDGVEGDEEYQYRFYYSSHRQHRREVKRSKGKRSKGKVVSPRKPRGEFGAERLILRNRDFHKFQVDPDAIILWPEWMLTETGFKGFRIIGKVPVDFHAGRHQFVIDIAGDKAKSFVYEPNNIEKSEGADLIAVTDSSGDKEQQMGKLQGGDFNMNFIPWKTYVV